MNLEDDIPFGVGVKRYSTKGGDFKYFLFSPLLGKNSHFD